jgi:N-acylneuraminate cytidylyltransferase
MSEVVAVVTARGGSMGFPGKNLARFRGRELVVHAALTAAAARTVGSVVVTTDSPEIANVAEKAGAVVVRRPAELSGASSRSVDAVLHVVAAIGVPDSSLVVLVQPTSPLRTVSDIDHCVDLYVGRGEGSVVQMAEPSAGHHPWKSCVLVDGKLLPTHDWASLEAPRQSLPVLLVPTGGVYVLRVGDLRAYMSFFVPEVVPQVIPAERALDIDHEADLVEAERRAASLDESL